MKHISIIGAGLAGSEAAWQAAQRGAEVTLYEMRPEKQTPAHKTGGFAELVCSNSLRGAGLENAVGVLKEEMRRLGSLIMAAADATRVPAGGALAVDRHGFSDYITQRIEAHPQIHVVRTEVQKVPLSEDMVTIVASGPLTEGALADDIARRTGGDSLYFYDAAAPIVSLESVDMTKAYRASRYGKGEAAYINCPMTEAEYRAFYEALVTAEKAPTHGFEKEKFFEGCMPVEVMAARGEDTLLYGPLKPVGLEHPVTGVRPFAVVQLRQDNAEGTLYNIVGFQTHLKWPEQRRVFGMIPGLEHAEFLRYGVMHRNTFLNAPRHLLPTYQLRGEERLLFAGQMTGVEGYVESASSGLVAGINAARLARGEAPLVFPETTCHGALAHYITTGEADHFQPMNVNFGLLPPLPQRIRKKREKKQRLAERALADIETFRAELKE
ncbi:methylenetetrahydrofolate--tRNA-(uracil(54)-C(5))-methyltransferase (FADH(2)-oxidizing) TrmFO [Selenomonas bovis]|uniref:Methylenetetrahydrofolate--tRNA-(uracil-5-)-methyltransferase TrmFO n=1 Tax=Selenomonas bovis TaxID=416586 RepID=A0A848BA92_9FIRM|nr:methylenetetrahydrofolate--tRNA-(uracil(54)-C(5))-methyltransferase (FADH(2)-oxidizing) TrmFO [Selenomonas bovis]MBQ1622516.1 methylenetetrahydrofolate--tRNA-(uracil(54)-C(5))-methyltransferase (FADH(2)-oxidizing) TrmFO [Selenomonas sp.]MCI6170784.1 methylenetetrahydrofolate--tRNA-(uracil(54)-C(5))-methyltransferase (FADH(2)-oxidizing) TrmFO [Selenomonas bovis]NMD98257.1 methylenetetrahydrofolate--tRNA-(uracil(54)-C(5))-methyltransferase (FADH(2)-oxidizing) TrmFO [Selenomonas bovis]